MMDGIAETPGVIAQFNLSGSSRATPAQSCFLADPSRAGEQSLGLSRPFESARLKSITQNRCTASLLSSDQNSNCHNPGTIFPLAFQLVLPVKGHASRYMVRIFTLKKRLPGLRIS